VPAGAPTHAQTPSHGFPPEYRLRKRSDFSQVYATGRSWPHPLLVVRTRPNGLDVSRFGFAIGKRLGKAVVRNLIRRRLREILRQTRVVPGFDLVIIGRPPVVSATYAALREGLLQVLQRAKLLAPGEGQ